MERPRCWDEALNADWFGNSGSLEKYFFDLPRQDFEQKIWLFLSKLWMQIYRDSLKIIAVIMSSLVHGASARLLSF